VRRQRARRAIAWGACIAASACGDGTHECATARCGGALPVVALVDEAGNPVAARGEQRSADYPAAPATAFDCEPADAGQPTLCARGQLLLSVFEAHPGTRVELRFQLRDGSWSDWQVLALDITSHTDPEFNGPGCPCTGYTATAQPIVVPVEARPPAP
jgi:hypothetical protein